MWVDIFENICPSVKYLHLHKKRKSESRLAPALPSPDATVGDLARTHCSTAVLQDWVLQMQSMVTYSQTAVANSSPMLFSAPSDKHERIYPWSTLDVPHFKCSYQPIYLRKSSSYLLSMEYTYQLWKSIIYLFYFNIYCFIRIKLYFTSNMKYKLISKREFCEDTVPRFEIRYKLSW